MLFKYIFQNNYLLLFQNFNKYLQKIEKYLEIQMSCNLLKKYGYISILLILFTY